MSAPATVTINGVTYKDGLDYGYRIIDGEVYAEDENHHGTILLTEEMAAKYSLDDDYRLEDDWYEEEWMDEDMKNFTHEICIDHAAAYVDPETGEETHNSPHGELYSEEFVAWWCGFDVDMLKESDDKVRIWGWCDG